MWVSSFHLHTYCMSTFLSPDRIKQAFTNFNEDDSTILDDLLDGCLAFVKHYTGQSFESASYTEQHDTTELNYFQLAHRPITNIIRVATGANVLTIQNTTAQRATVSVTPTGVTLNSATSGVVTTTTKTFATYPTYTTLAAAISATSGWTCTVSGSYGSHESSTLRQQYGVPCLTSNTLEGYVVDVNFVLQAPATVVVPLWIGLGTCRVDYTAGYTVCPDDLAMVIGELCQLAYSQRTINPNLVSYSNGAYSWSKALGAGFEQLSAPSRKALARYKLPRISGAFIV